MPLHTACCETCLASKSCLCAALWASQPRKHSLAEGFVHQTLNYLFIWGYPGFHLFRTAGSPSQGSPFGLPGSGVSRGKLLMQNTALKLPTLPQPGVRDSQDRSLKTCSALCQGAMAVLSTGQSSHTGTRQVTNPGAWSPFLLLLPRSRSTKHLFVIPVPNEEALGQPGGNLHYHFSGGTGLVLQVKAFSLPVVFYASYPHH